ncbi:DNA topoisomerase, partial [Streptomyces sp. Ncost-T6T-2b]
ASRKLGFGAKATMQVAQKLYENGFITYMRTDSTTLSDTAVSAARAQVTQLYGANYLPEKPRTYAGKVKNAQEAHEATPPLRRPLPHPRRDRAHRRPVPALRADLEADRRLPDEGRDG